MITYLFEYMFSPHADGIIRKKSIVQKQIHDGGTVRKHLGTTYSPPANSLLQPNPLFLLQSLSTITQPLAPHAKIGMKAPLPPESNGTRGHHHLNGHTSLLEQNRKRKFSSNGFQTDAWGLPIRGNAASSNVATFTSLKKKRFTPHSPAEENNIATTSIEASQSDLLDLLQSFILPGIVSLLKFGNFLSQDLSFPSFTGQTERMEVLTDVYLNFLMRVQDPRPTYDQ